MGKLLLRVFVKVFPLPVAEPPDAIAAVAPCCCILKGRAMASTISQKKFSTVSAAYMPSISGLNSSIRSLIFSEIFPGMPE